MMLDVQVLDALRGPVTYLTMPVTQRNPVVRCGWDRRQRRIHHPGKRDFR